MIIAIALVATAPSIANADTDSAIDWCLDIANTPAEFHDCMDRFEAGRCETDLECESFFGKEGN